MKSIFIKTAGYNLLYKERRYFKWGMGTALK